MAMRLTRPVAASWIAGQLGLVATGPKREIDHLCTLDILGAGGLSFALPGRRIEAPREGVVVALPELAAEGLCILASENPRLDFIRAQYLLQSTPGFERVSAPARVHPTASIGRGAVIEDDVTIGEGTTIGHNAVILAGTRIGRFCDIQSGAVIGDAGFGFERDGDKRPLRMVHLGGVCIGDHVEIGANTCIARGALGDTVLGDHVKVNNLVHIAHNCRIGAGTMIGACADLCGSLEIGKNCWIAPNCSIRQKLVIGEDAIVGMGAVVVRDVEAATTVYGNPASAHSDGAQAKRLRARAPTRTKKPATAGRAKTRNVDRSSERETQARSAV
jgi:UDP-3-O-[3-hydroxymyristoyl] glucosamine N-acyltransferase LpxD